MLQQLGPTLGGGTQNSKQIIAEKSGHFIIIDRPDVVTEAIRQAVQSGPGWREALATDGPELGNWPSEKWTTTTGANS
jgi:hypothetical protein